MDKSSRIGTKYPTKQGYIATIIEYQDSQNVSVQFNDENETIINNVRFYWLQKGAGFLCL